MSIKNLLDKATDSATTSVEILNKAYDDVVHPVAQNIGEALGTLTSTINSFLKPISWAVYGFYIIDKNVKSSLEEKLSKTPLEELKEPEANIIIPAYEALRYSLDKKQLKDMYVSLIANSMKKDTAEKVHPSFVEVVRQLSVFDAEVLKKIFGNSTQSIPKVKVRLQKSNTDKVGIDIHNIVLSPRYYDASYVDKYVVSLENLERLKVIEINDDVEIIVTDIYNDIIDIIGIDELKRLRPDLPYVEISKGKISLTNFGRELIKNIF